MAEQTIPRFPLTDEQRDDLGGASGDHMDTAVTIAAQGGMSAATYIWEDTKTAR
jgi:hypothetical protein